MGSVQIILLLMISKTFYLATATRTKTARDSLFAEVDSAGFFPPEDSEAKASERDVYEDSTNAAHVTYNKDEYLGDMIKNYFSYHQAPPHTTAMPLSSAPPSLSSPVVKGEKGQMGGYGKIDISIQYGCCASPSNAAHDKSSPDPRPIEFIQGPVLPAGETARFVSPPPGLGTGFFYEDPFMVSPGDVGQSLVGLVRSEDTKPFEHSSASEKYIFNPRIDTETQSKLFYRPEGLSSSNINPNQQKQQNRYPELQFKNGYFNHPPHLASSTLHPYTSSSRKIFSTSVPTTPSTTTPRSYSIVRDFNNNKPYKYSYDRTTTTSKPPTPKSQIQKSPGYMSPKTDIRNNVYGNQRKQPFFNDSPIVITREQFYTNYPPFYNPSTLPPLSPITVLNRGLPIPAERSSFYTSERLIPPMNLYGAYLQPSPLDVQPLSSINGARYYQGLQKSTNTGSIPNTPEYGNHVTPRNILHGVGKLVIQNVPKSALYPSEHPRDNPGNFQQSNLPLTSSNSWTNQHHETANSQLMEQNISTPKPDPYGPNNYALIEKNREIFFKMQNDAFGYFKDAALKDFKEILNKDIDKKKIDVLPEEKSLLNRKTELNEDLGLIFLDFLTIYERYSEVLNDTDLRNHILHDMDRAKEYLSMKLNKFWLELDEMDTPEEFLDKKNYYKNREKPSGLMNLLYDWYERISCNPDDVDVEQIKGELFGIMKREKRYWLLLLRN